ncbi:MAG TPA: sulfurtransferase TusA family protein [Arenibaculum sp.]|nr:sulfurtransferase TusA family protein [Arenibaculum sp.]
MSDPKTISHFLDITGDVCPLTFVRTKLRLARMASGEILEIRLNAGEPLDNVPRSAAELGHGVEVLGPEDPALPEGVHRIRICKS